MRMFAIRKKKTEEIEELHTAFGWVSLIFSEERQAKAYAAACMMVEPQYEVAPVSVQPIRKSERS